MFNHTRVLRTVAISSLSTIYLAHAVQGLNDKRNFKNPAVKTCRAVAYNQEDKDDDITVLTSVGLSASEEDAYWEKKKAECSFCRFFLESPCIEQFKLWSKCVDLAKKEEKDFKDECTSVSKSLFECTSSHHEYFKQLMDADESSEGVVEDESSNKTEDGDRDGVVVAEVEVEAEQTPLDDNMSDRVLYVYKNNAKQHDN